ncbi:acetyl-CoA carboxylase biotin carboxyl carrier protein [Brumimicrobium aurantiacum]|uniref:Biotin carboxyl carrier protein of acetyl-CoA carboxylase n=1 Tax=Brumimicrobium aurantiacum TaxID=1737063 RepID=A0A3E1F2D6_9FLAO|nr:acetyl-CoA carboxylase biotin carboxyl carrier protein [Brumimicrobium aurantiacum]RFC55988.1 acetyl-CoA carboxylase biotin carboxyl carrier protein [Brumimicrobium aurantiacum]
MNQKEIQELIKFVSKSGVTEVEIEEKDFKITIKSEPKRKKEEAKETVYIQQPMQAMPQQQPVQTQMPQAAPAPAATQEKAPEANDDSKYITVKSPMIGTFYRSPSPEKPVFVEVGDTIKNGDPVCIIEAMKLFNEIEAEVQGKIVKVLVDDASPVEYDQPLFLVDPS